MVFLILNEKKKLLNFQPELVHNNTQHSTAHITCNHLLSSCRFSTCCSSSNSSLPLRRRRLLVGSFVTDTHMMCVCVFLSFCLHYLVFRSFEIGIPYKFAGPVDNRYTITTANYGGSDN